MSFKAVLEADIKGFSSNIDKAISDVDRLEKTTLQKLSKVGDSFISIGKKASILSVAVAAAGAKAFSMAADFQDAMGATDQVFKDASGSVQAWADNLDTSYGIAKKEALSYSNLMGSMLINIGRLTEDQAAKQSATLIELAGDLTAMYGGTTQEAVRALTGALKGNNTMLDNYGMAVNDALIKQKALELGLISGTREMSLQARQAATLALIWEQTGAAQGQAAREADGASGAMRAFRTEVSNLSTELGEVLLPIITPIITKLGELAQNFRGLSPEMQSMIVGIAGVTAVAGPLLIVIGNILKTLPLIKAALVALTGPIGAIAVTMTVVAVNFHKNIEAIRTDFDFFTEHIKTTSAGIGDVLSGNFSGWWDKVRTTWGKNIDYIRDKWNQFIAYFTGEKGLKQSQAGLEAALAANEMTGSAGAMQEVAKSAAIAASSVDNLTTSFRELGEAQEAATAKIVPDDVTGVSVLAPVIEPTIDAQGLKEKLRDTTYGALADLGEGIKVITIDLSSMLSGALTDVFGSVADAMMNGDNMMAALGASLLGTLGGIMVQLGQMVIATGSAIEAVKVALTSLGGFGAIAAGVALIAIGSLFKAGAKKLGSSMGGGGYSSAPSLRNTGPGYAPSEYRGQYQDDFKVEFKIGTNELVGVLNTAEQRRNRL